MNHDKLHKHLQELATALEQMLCSQEALRGLFDPSNPTSVQQRERLIQAAQALREQSVHWMAHIEADHLGT